MGTLTAPEITPFFTESRLTTISPGDPRVSHIPRDLYNKSNEELSALTWTMVTIIGFERYVGGEKRWLGVPSGAWC